MRVVVAGGGVAGIETVLVLQSLAGEYLPGWLAEHGMAPQGAHEPPRAGIVVERPLSALRAPEYQYLYDLAREFRSDDPEVIALGRRMRETRAR